MALCVVWTRGLETTVGWLAVCVVISGGEGRGRGRGLGNMGIWGMGSEGVAMYLHRVVLLSGACGGSSLGYEVRFVNAIVVYNVL